eukprot:1179908-Prorocentrum_minimum.AAC.7
MLRCHPARRAIRDITRYFTDVVCPCGARMSLVRCQLGLFQDSAEYSSLALGVMRTRHWHSAELATTSDW